MARLNIAPERIRTHEGGIAHKTNVEEQLRRSVMTCLLWEDSFYESGESIAERIQKLSMMVSEKFLADLAVEARDKLKLRHLPLLLVRILAKRRSKLTGRTLTDVIQRVDELMEFVAIYWKDGKQPLSAQVKKGLASAFHKFNEYQFAKYNRDGAIKLRDVLFLCHAKPIAKEQTQLFKKIANNQLETPDTWEVALSTGNDKKETFTRLIQEKKLGGLALLRNLRNMIESKVSDAIISMAILEMDARKVLPFRFLSAVKYGQRFANELEHKMLQSVEGFKLPGKTIILVDVSGSMAHPISSKSDMKRMEAACGLAILCREVCETIQVFSFSDNLAEVMPLRGLALGALIIQSQPNSSTELGKALNEVNQKMTYDRIIIITDEQSSDSITNAKTDKSYILNLASYQNGIGYSGGWIHITGFSESIIKYISEIEKEKND